MRYLKILGICVAGIVGLLGVAIGIAALSGAFSKKPIHISAIYFEVESEINNDDEVDEEGGNNNQRIQSIYDIIQTEKSYTVKYEPANANDLELAITVEGDKNIFENVPSTITAGKPFVLKPVVKDGYNVSGSACLKITNPYCSVDCLIYVAVDIMAEEKLQINSEGNLTYSDCFTFEIGRDENYNLNETPGITEATGVSSSTSNITYNFINSTPKTFWVNSIYNNILDIDTGGVFPAGSNIATSNLFRKVSFELVREKSGSTTSEGVFLDSLVP